jgi:lipopolysaccharide export system permease protein
MASGVSKFPKLQFRIFDGFPKLSVMDRYISSELILPFLFGVGLFTSLGVSVGAVFELIRRIADASLGIDTAIKILLLNMPQFIAYALPMSTLLATLMTYNRLSSDSELIALRSCGVSIRRLVLPAIILSLVVTGIMFAFNEMIVPQANLQAAITFDQALGRNRPTFQQRDILYQQFEPVREEDGRVRDQLTRLFYAKQFNGERMRGVTILDFSRGELSQIVSAEAASWNQTENTWDFSQGTIYAVSTDGSFSNIVRFQEQQIQMPRTPLDIASRDLDYGEMNIVQAQEELELLKQTGNESNIRKMRVRIQQKWALPFACLVMGLVGSVLGTKPKRAGRATSFAISVLMIFSYYLLFSITGAVAETGAISPFLGAWLPNILGLVLGGGLLWQASR